MRALTVSTAAIMRDHLLVTIIISVIVGAMIWHGLSTRVFPYRHRSYSWWFTLKLGWFTPYNHIKFGKSCPTDLILQRAGYAVGYSNKRRCALWVSYVLSKWSIGVDVERGEGYHSDHDVLKRYRVEPEHCENSGYDKGHLAPSASIDFSRQSNDQTFLMTNVALQHPELNRQAWGKLERLVRKWSFTKGKLVIIAGPVYGQRNTRFNKIPIPRYFYKVIYSLQHKRSIAFILPNKAIENDQLWSSEHVMSVKDLEEFIQKSNPRSNLSYNFLQALGSRGEQIKARLDIPFWRDEKEWNEK